MRKFERIGLPSSLVSSKPLSICRYHVPIASRTYSAPRIPTRCYPASRRHARRSWTLRRPASRSPASMALLKMRQTSSPDLITLLGFSVNLLTRRLEKNRLHGF